MVFKPFPEGNPADTAELLSLINNNNVGMSILGLRYETDFNLFHIADSKLVAMAQVRNPGWVKKLPVETILVLVLNDEKRTTEAWFDLGLKRSKVRGIVLITVEWLDEKLEQFQVIQDKRSKINGKLAPRYFICRDNRVE